ncbi:MAG: Fur family transcriptional regulator [Paracoccaceae bacterium]
MVRDPETKAMRPHDHDVCISGALAAAEAASLRGGVNFTPVRRRALEILLESHAALGAYDLLKRLDQDGFGGQPPVAYRALEFLVKHGFAHRIERLNAFVACVRPGEGHGAAFMICRKCHAVAETVTDPAATQLGRDARALGFDIESTVMEAEGVCPKCREAS